MTTKQSMTFSKAPSEKHECRFCGNLYSRLSTLTVHMCPKKQRFLDKDSTGTRFGFIAFDKFYKYAFPRTKPKNLDEFLDSDYYVEFVKLGHHLATLRPLYMDQYIDFVIRSGLKLTEWCRDDLYELYIRELLKKEPADAAVDRSITEMIEWSEKNNVEFKDFFDKISANEAAYMIRTGRISPWVLYLCNSGGEFINNFNADHTKMIGNIIDPVFWKQKFTRNMDDREYVENLLEQLAL